MKGTLCLAFLALGLLNVVCSSDINGYVVYCPCMGRFGNQADHFLGSLSFAKSLNRTLVLPPWIEYVPYSAKTILVPFDKYFQVEPLSQFHQVITMEEFMKDVAPSVWPPGKRTVFCYSGRDGKDGKDPCSAKSGNPFQLFWDSFQVDFDENEFYSPLSYYSDMTDEWEKKYPPDKFPVMAFSGAPAAFPVQGENRALHKYLVWSESVKKSGDDFVRKIFPKGPYVGIHLRNGVDWDRVCEHVNESNNLFSSPQCLGYNNEFGKLTMELCSPSFATIEKQLLEAVEEQKAVAVFVASDHNHLIKELGKTLDKLKVEVFNYEPPNPHTDLYLLGRSNHLIANCVSSFSAFAVRERQVHGLPYSFWGFSKDKTKSHEEL